MEALELHKVQHAEEELRRHRDHEQHRLSTHASLRNLTRVQRAQVPGAGRGAGLTFETQTSHPALLMDAKTSPMVVPEHRPSLAKYGSSVKSAEKL